MKLTDKQALQRKGSNTCNPFAKKRPPRSRHARGRTRKAPPMAPEAHPAQNGSKSCSHSPPSCTRPNFAGGRSRPRPNFAGVRRRLVVHIQPRGLEACSWRWKQARRQGYSVSSNHHYPRRHRRRGTTLGRVCGVPRRLGAGITTGRMVYPMASKSLQIRWTVYCPHFV